MPTWLRVAQRPAESVYGGLALSAALEGELRTLWDTVAAASENSPLRQTLHRQSFTDIIVQRGNGIITDPYSTLVSSDPELREHEHDTLLTATSVGSVVNVSDLPMNRSELSATAEDAEHFDLAGAHEDEQDFAVDGYLRCRKGDALNNGAYIIVKELGVGQSSRVYLARYTRGGEDNKMPEFVAIKIYRCEAKLLDSMHYERMLLEYVRDRMRAMKIRDPGISILLDAFVHQGEFGQHPCLVFEVLGAPLDALMEQYAFQGVELGVVRKILTSLLETLEQLEKLCVIHTDLKAENLILVKLPPSILEVMGQQPQQHSLDAPAADDFRVKIVDFGLSYLEPPEIRRQRGSAPGSLSGSPVGSPTKRTAQPQLTARELELLHVGNYTRGTIIQTREYRAPEIILGMDFNTRADIFSFGCLAYELVTGRFLFDPKASFAEVPSDDEMDAQHLRDIAEFWGAPPPADMLIREGVHTKRFFTRGVFKHAKLPPTATRQQLEDELLRVMPKSEATEFLSFVRGCTQWDPAARSSPTALLRHKWLLRK